MLVFSERKHIESILTNSLMGKKSTLQILHDYGYAFTLSIGAKVGYVFLHTKNQGMLHAAVETATQDERTLTAYKRKALSTYCLNNGISCNVFELWVSLMERAAVGEKVSMPAMPALNLPGNIMKQVYEALQSLSGGDEASVMESIADMHQLLSDVSSETGIAYDSRKFHKAFNPATTRKARCANHLEYLSSVLTCCDDLHRYIQHQGILQEIEKQKQTWN